MSSIDPKLNNGPNVQDLKDETLTTNLAAGTPTPSPAAVTGDATAGIEPSVSDIGVTINSALPAFPDLSLTSGLNIDSFFDLGGAINSPFGDFSLSQIPSDLTGLFGSEFSIDDIADQFGIGGLLGQVPISVNTNVAPKLDPKRNVLHQFASHTYRITMGAQDIYDHQETQSEDFKIGTPKITTMMMASGGAHAVDNVTRDPIFKEDFYIEDFKMATIIGNNEQGSGSNAVNIEFNIVEPYAVSLIERLLALAEKLGYENYIEIPYVFKIEFIGYNDDGDMLGVIPQTTKYIPFRLTYMKFEVSGMGSMYSCTAIPMNHFAFNQTVSAIPEEIEIFATNIGEFFNGAPGGAPGRGHTTGGFVDAVNAFHTNLATKTGPDSPKNENPRNAADKIKIVLHDDFKRHQLKVGNLENVGMIKEGFAGNVHMDPTKPKYGFHPGTAIEKVIQKMIEASTFMTEQVVEHERIDKHNATTIGPHGRGVELEKKPIIMIHITASYKMLEYDARANRHAYEATFYVNPFASPGHQSPSAGRSEIENIAKEYDYLFTGNNQDILNLNVKFDLAFYNSMAANTKSAGDGSGSGVDSAVKGADQGDKNSNNSGKVNPTAIEYQRASAKDNTQTAAKEDYKKTKATALMKSIMESSKGDMITLDLEILGDPAFIKQDDILYRSTSDTADAFTDNGSIKQDNGDMFIRLRFRTFDDIDHNTGLRTENIQIPNSTFSRKSTFDGFYRVIMLENVFLKGTFTQNLVVIRTYVQEDDEPESDAVTNMNSSMVSFAAGTTATATATAEAARHRAIDQFASDLEGELSASEQVFEQQTFPAPFYAEQTPVDAAEYLPVNENLIPGDLGFTPNAESIKELTNKQTLDADRANRTGR